MNGDSPEFDEYVKTVNENGIVKSRRAVARDAWNAAITAMKKRLNKT